MMPKPIANGIISEAIAFGVAAVPTNTVNAEQHTVPPMCIGFVLKVITAFSAKANQNKGWGIITFATHCEILPNAESVIA